MRFGPSLSCGPDPIFIIKLFKIVSHKHMGLGLEVWSPNHSKLIHQIASCTILSWSQLQGFHLLKLIKWNHPPAPPTTQHTTMTTACPWAVVGWDGKEHTWHIQSLHLQEEYPWPWINLAESPNGISLCSGESFVWQGCLLRPLWLVTSKCGKPWTQNNFPPFHKFAFYFLMQQWRV